MSTSEVGPRYVQAGMPFSTLADQLAVPVQRVQQQTTCKAMVATLDSLVSVLAQYDGKSESAVRDKFLKSESAGKMCGWR
jgi:hypothetical protein